jgi:DNA polymerase-3 subunit alpha
MRRHEARFVKGALERGVSETDAKYIFELVNKFAGYGFNKSHAAAYALVSYQTAYMKANYREEFLAASMTLDMGNTDKLALFAAEAKRSGIEVKPPCVNASEVDFLAEPSQVPEKLGAIRYSLAALKNIGAAAVSTIVAERDAHGAYASLADFAARMNPKALNKRGIETLAAAGAFDALEANRALAYTNVEGILALAQRREANSASGTDDLFGIGEAAPQLDLRSAQVWTPMERLAHEFEAIGFYLSGHPLDSYERVLHKLGVKRYAEFEALTERGSCEGRLAGIVISARERKSQRGNKFAFAMFSDTTGQFEAVVFSDTLNQCRELLEPGTPVLLAVSAERDGDTVKMRIEGLEALDKAAANVQRGLKVVLDRDALQAGAAAVSQLKAHLKRGGKGEIRLVLALEDRGQEVELTIPGRYDVSPARAGILSTTPGVVEVLEI